MVIDRDIVPDALKKDCRRVGWKSVLFARPEFVVIDNPRQEVLEIHFLDDRGRKGYLDMGESVRAQVAGSIGEVKADEVEEWARQKIAEAAAQQGLEFSAEKPAPAPSL